MLKHKNRIINKADFGRIKQRRESFFSGNIELKIAGNNLGETRVGFIVGLGFSKKAVERNKAKRWARETLRKHLPQLSSGNDLLVVIRKKDAKRIRKEYLMEDIEKVLKKIA